MMASRSSPTDHMEPSRLAEAQQPASLSPITLNLPPQECSPPRQVNASSCSSSSSSSMSSASTGPMASSKALLNSANRYAPYQKVDPKVAIPKKSQPKMVTRTKKIFVGGLSANTTVDDIKAYFGQFGPVEDAMLMFDKTTQRHRGFGFVTFENEDVVEKVCEVHFHEINNKMVECKKAQPKEVMLPAQLAAARGRSLARGILPTSLATYAAAAQFYSRAALANAASVAAAQTAAAQPQATSLYLPTLPGYYIPATALTGSNDASQLAVSQLAARQNSAAAQVAAEQAARAQLFSAIPGFHANSHQAATRGYSHSANSPGPLTELYSSGGAGAGAGNASSSVVTDAALVNYLQQAAAANNAGSHQIAITGLTAPLIATAFQNGFH